MTALKAVLLDMDGVITDTEMVDHRIQVAFVRAVNEERDMGSGDLPFERLIGLSGDGLLEELNALTGGFLPRAELRARFSAFDSAARADIDYRELYRPQVGDLLDFAHTHGLGTAVVSSSSFARIAEVLDVCGIGECFDVVMSGDAVEKSKPDPEIYRRAIAQLGVEPRACVAIEDSAAGIAAAKAAGTVVIAYKERRMPVDQSAADYLARDMSDAVQLVHDLYVASHA